MDSHDLALEELKLLEIIILHQEEIRMKLRNWGVTVVAGVSIAFLSADLGISRIGYYLLAFGVSALFWLLEATYQVAEMRAIWRGAYVEQVLRREATYDGPRIGASLETGHDWRGMLVAVARGLTYARLMLPYVALSLIVGVIGLV